MSVHTQLQQQITCEADEQLACSIFSTADANVINDHLNRYCKAQFNQLIAACSFAYLSVGATFVVQLTDGTHLALKANGPHQNVASLTACCKIQKTLAEQGFPCPDVLRLPQRFEASVITAQTFCEPGERVNPDDAVTARQLSHTLARYLAKLIQQSNSLPQTALPKADLSPWMELHQTRLWHRPHNILFDFEKTAAGAEWIDEIAREAKQILRAATGPVVIGHSDWSLQNMSFRQNTLAQQTLAQQTLRCVYDWDSLRVGLEPCFVGGAARCFRHDWRYGPPEKAISIEEVQQFIAAYEQERGQMFSAAERRVIDAAVVYTAAYGVRCGHAIAKPNDIYHRQSKHQLEQFTEVFLEKNI